MSIYLSPRLANAERRSTRLSRPTPVPGRAQIVPFEAASHPFQLAQPLFVADERLRTVLGVNAPDLEAALAETVAWLWEHGQDT